MKYIVRAKIQMGFIELHDGCPCGNNAQIIDCFLFESYSIPRKEEIIKGIEILLRETHTDNLEKYDYKFKIEILSVHREINLPLTP